MRIFETLTEASSEIKRDLSKSRGTSTHLVQGQIAIEDADYYELIGYSYMILNPIPQEEAVRVSRELGYISSQEEEDEYIQFLAEESRLRKLSFFYSAKGESDSDIPDFAEFFNPSNLSDLHHRSLRKVQNLGYSYSERLFCGYRYIEEELKRDRYSRRLFVPVFWPSDFQHIHEAVRVPCTLGYQFLIRRRSHYIADHATLIYYMRSNDLTRFWASDLYFASELLTEFCRRTKTEYSGIIHSVSSLHSWIGNEEIY